MVEKKARESMRLESRLHRKNGFPKDLFQVRFLVAPPQFLNQFIYLSKNSKYHFWGKKTQNAKLCQEMPFPLGEN